jgi:dihydroflavonol-4-reductase
MKYLVTGATGLLGNNIVRELLARGQSVRVLTRTTSDPRPLQGLGVERIAGDVTDAAAMARACQGVDVVIHAAGHVHIGWSQREVHEQINVGGTQNVARAARQAKARMVHVSSVNALGLGPLRAPASEESALAGIVECPYVATKRRGEEIVLSEVGQGLDAVIVNPGFMLGPWDWKPSSGRMLLEVARFAPLAPVGAFSVCDVRDVAAGTLAAVEKGRTGRRYILAGHNLTYMQAWRHFARVAGSPGPWFWAGPINRWIGGWWGDRAYARTGREPELNSAAIAMSCQHHCFVSTRAESELGYQVRPLEETIQAAWTWFVEHGYVQPRRIG